MEQRLLAFLNAEKLNSSRFADMLGVQRSAISHIITGRNKPGFDFLVKIFEKFPALSMEWLILGKGNMYKTATHIQKTLFENIDNQSNIQSKTEDQVAKDTIQNVEHPEEIIGSTMKSSSVIPVEKVIVLYSDKSFEEYRAR